MMPSITSCNRLEVDTHDPETHATVAARILDPLWTLARQWQVGEFQAARPSQMRAVRP
jgi:hypothetical protein